MPAIAVARSQLSTRPAAIARPLLLIVIAAAVAAAFMLTGHDQAERAVAEAGGDLTRLLRAMAAIKMVVAVAVTAGILWRLGSAATPPWLIAYALACAAMAAGPVLIWQMAYVGSGTLLLHGGLLSALVLLWRDPVVGSRLLAAIAARRQAIDRGTGLRS